MQVHFHHYFDKRFSKLPVKIQLKATKQIQTFQADPFNSILNNHALTGKHLGLRSINITGNYRAIYDPVSSNAALFVDIGTHSQLYG